MAYEDFTTYTEDNGTGVLTVITNKITAVDCDRDIDALVYKDKGAGHFGDFEHLVTVRCETASLHGCVGAVWMLANVVDDANAADALKFTLNYNKNGNILNFILGEGTGTGAQIDWWGAEDAGNIRYLTIKRAGTALTVKIYSDSARTNLLHTLSLTVATTAYRYIYGFASFNSAEGGYDFDGYSQNLDLQEIVLGRSFGFIIG